MSPQTQPVVVEDVRTLTELTDYIASLVGIGDVDAATGYEKSADAMWLAAAATFNLVAREMGVTGFQASWAALRFYGEVMNVRGPFMVVRIEDALYPQYDLVNRVSKYIDEQSDWLAEQARERLAGDLTWVAESVERHWRKLAARKPKAEVSA